MKKIMLVLIVTALILGSWITIAHFEKQNESNPDKCINQTENDINQTAITSEKAINIAKNNINEIERDTITNFDSPKVEELEFDKKLSIYLLENESDLLGKQMYRITFNTTQDGLLGPIVYYIDKENGKIVGMDYRE